MSKPKKKTPTSQGDLAAALAEGLGAGRLAADQLDRVRAAHRANLLARLQSLDECADDAQKKLRELRQQVRAAIDELAAGNDGELALHKFELTAVSFTALERACLVTLEARRLTLAALYPESLPG